LVNHLLARNILDDNCYNLYSIKW